MDIPWRLGSAQLNLEVRQMRPFRGKFPFSSLLLLLLVLSVPACAPRIDGSSEEAFQSSLAEVRESLNGDDRERFAEALTALAFEEAGLEGLLALGPDAMTREMRLKLDGKTGGEILVEAEEIIAERKRREREQALAEIVELEEKKRAAERAGVELRRFVVVRSRFYKQPQRFGSPEPRIELTVRNDTDHAVSRAYFTGTIASPNRSVPWLKDDFNYPIPGGIEPGEELSWTLAPNTFSDWGRVDAPPDAVLTVEVVRLDGPDGEPLFDAQGLSEYEETRLQSLKDQYESPN